MSPTSELLPAASATDLAAALALDVEQAAALVGLGQAIASRGAELLQDALGQPITLGRAAARRLDPGEADREDWDTYHPVDVQWQMDGSSYSAIVLLPTAQLQTLFPDARGASELPDWEALGQVLRRVADELTTELSQRFQPAVRLSLPDGGNAPHDEGSAYLRLEHTISAGPPSAQTDLQVVYLVPEAALRSFAAQANQTTSAFAAQPVDSGPSGAAPGHPREASSRGNPPAAPPTAAGYSGTGGGVSTMEDHMTAATQPVGTSVHPVEFEPIADGLDAKSATNLDLLLDVGLRVTVELGRTEKTIKEVLALGPGSVIELDKLAGEPVDILVNGRLIAKGEVVAVDENWGVRVTDIMSPQHRLARMR